MSEPLFEREQIMDALKRVGEKVYLRGKRADIFVFGGAAMVIAYQARPATRDVDAVFEPDTGSARREHGETLKDRAVMLIEDILAQPP